MLFVDKNLILTRLDYIKDLTKEIDTDNTLALERVCEMLIEASVDVGNMIIDAFVLRDPGNYLDVMDIMKTEGVVSEDDFKKFEETFKFRNNLVREYEDIDHEKMRKVFKENLSAYQDFKESVLHFFETDPQAVTAFIGDQHV
ncbi:type VII toxin-antitoxin system HepT family RNase toxin [Nosocomiicoccus ampullae]|uniref:Uncharacterized protein YutE (UPF0331/DUF86 family) n=1 Tax=Nosocomiicoccus ampullae TaxID=489910 RepID=A0A9Q2HEW5_9STAP|nr:DUF86 domain-containing protein [Nosocomiicoccus ampullae]MBB5175798.1 uncharacterized protein YutE (UPF0331/DUF86 family) [Nosocomiicoccus ampullae]QYA47180.1 DUF86 domain-containing protein [Nosocomiicoccus ampullae]QYA48806.1 DUF86 domain-containing protein [Nosocomiicoccus ampullae]